ncbi:hypothetical protein CRUP_003986 [Coryphaenoides rupestris]|nr:hypothetical protein CRUP_003986 [Coryphaenoides rupestris]
MGRVEVEVVVVVVVVEVVVLAGPLWLFQRLSVSIASSLVGEDAKTKFLSKMGQLTTSGAMLANVFQRKK